MQIGKDYIGVSSGAVIKNTEGKYFLAKRSNGARDDQGMWEFPGGQVSLFETRREAILRIIKEKYDFNIEINEVLGVYDVVDMDAKDHWLSTTYFANYASGEPKIIEPEKCDEIGWFSLDEIKNLDLSRITKLNLKDLKLSS